MKNVRLFRRGLALLWERIPSLILYRLAFDLTSALMPFLPLYLSGMIITALADGDTYLAGTYAAYTVLGAFAGTMLNAWAAWGYQIAMRALWSIQRQLFAEKLMRLDYAALDSAAAQEKRERVTRMEGETGTQLSDIVIILGYLLRSATAICVSAALALRIVLSDGGTGAWIDTPVASILYLLITFALIFLVTAASKYVDRDYFAREEQVTVFNRTIHFFTGEYLQDYRSGRDVRMLGLSKLINAVCDQKQESALAVRARLFAARSAMSGVREGAGTLVTGLIVAYVSLKAMAGSIGIGMLVTGVGAMAQMMTGVFMCSIYLLDIGREGQYLTALFDYLDTPEVMYKGKIPVEKRDDNEYRIAFENVSFRYPGAEDWALRDFSCAFTVGRRYAVVGPNGSGKTTMIKLLVRLYDPTEGRVTLNGVDIRKYDYEQYLSLFGVVFQDFKLFSLPLGENVACRADYDEARVRDAIRLSGAPELPLDTPLYRNFDEGGTDISGGEAQKLALARALYKKASFLVLDEPTAALDPKAEYALYTSFDAIIGSRTAVYISHRLSSCRFAADILVFDKGRLMERGGHDELLDMNGLYRTMWDAQAQYYA